MKKFLSLLVVLCVMVTLPMGVKAFSLDTKNACEKSCPNKDGRCTQTCKINIKDNNRSLTDMNITLKYGTGVSVKSVNPSTGWENVSTSNDKLSFITNTPVSTKDFTIATVVFDVENAETDCTINVGIDNASYEITVDQTTQVKTGASLPIAIIGCGAVAAVAIYLTTKKSKKMYKI